MICGATHFWTSDRGAACRRWLLAGSARQASLARARIRASGGEQQTRPPLLPGFAVAFALLVAINSIGLVPAPVQALGSDVSRWMLVAAIAGIGMKTQLKDVAARALESTDPLNTLRGARIDVRLDGATQPLRLSFLPRLVANLFHDFNPGVAGLILVVSSFLSGSRVGLFAFPGAALTFFGPSFGLAPTVAMAFGAGVAALGLFLGRSRND